jgi:hypothetical protein
VGAHLAVAVGRDGRQGGSRQVQPVLKRSLALRPQMGPAPGTSSKRSGRQGGTTAAAHRKQAFAAAKQNRWGHNRSSFQMARPNHGDSCPRGQN